MVTETLTSKQQNDNLRSYFVVFDTHSGKIHKINNSYVKTVDDAHTQIETVNSVCNDIIKGKKSLKKYGMVWDIINEKWDIGKRSTTLIIESTHNKLIPFDKNIDPSTAEIFVKVFYDARKIVVEANRENITSIKNLSDITEISTTETNLLDIYVTRKNDPDYLINTINVDPLTLFKRGRQNIFLKDSLSTHVDWENISLYAKSVFNTYGWSVQSINTGAASTGTHKVVQQSNVEDSFNININVVDNVMNIESKLTLAENYFFGGRNKMRFVVCNNHIDNLVGAFEVSTEQLLQDTSTVNINFKWPDNPILLYKNNYLAVSTHGETA